MHVRGKTRGNRSVHRGGHNGNLEFQVANGHFGGGQLGVDRDLTGNDCYFVEAVRALKFFEQSSPHPYAPLSLAILWLI